MLFVCLVECRSLIGTSPILIVVYMHRKMFGYLVLKISKADEDQRFCEALSLLLVGIGGLGAGRVILANKSFPN